MSDPKPTPIESIATSLEAFDRRQSDADKRMVTMEGHLADGARSADEQAKSYQKLSELYVAIDERLGRIEALLSNYVTETTRLRSQASRLNATSEKLISEVREKLKAVNG